MVNGRCRTETVDLAPGERSRRTDRNQDVTRRLIGQSPFDDVDEPIGCRDDEPGVAFSRCRTETDRFGEGVSVRVCERTECHASPRTVDQCIVDAARDLHTVGDSHDKTSGRHVGDGAQTVECSGREEVDVVDQDDAKGGDRSRHEGIDDLRDIVIGRSQRVAENACGCCFSDEATASDPCRTGDENTVVSAEKAPNQMQIRVTTDEWSRYMAGARQPHEPVPVVVTVEACGREDGA